MRSNTPIYSNTIHVQFTSLDKRLYINFPVELGHTNQTLLKPNTHTKLFLQRVLYYSSHSAFTY